MRLKRDVYVHESSTIPDAWLNIVDSVDKQGTIVPDEDYPGMKRKEFLCITCIVDRPSGKPMIPKRFPWDDFVGISVNDYIEMFTSKEKGKVSGEILTKILERETKNRVQRTANLGITEPPRLLTFKPVIREWGEKNELDLIAVFSELDVYAELPPHAVGLARLAETLTKRLAVVQNASTGALYLLIQCGYIREIHFADIHRLLALEK